MPLSPEHLHAVVRIASKIRHFPNGVRAIEYATKYDSEGEILGTVLASYDDLIITMYTLRDYELSFMPFTQIFLEKTWGENLPPIDIMLTSPDWTPHMNEAIGNLYIMMKRAQENFETQSEIYPKDETIYFGTKVFNPYAYLIGVTGHSMERLILATINPPDGQEWQKDDFLHACCETAMLQAARGQESPLLAIYSGIHELGGLGWISNKWYRELNTNYIRYNP